jgi:hypothetical protein
MKQTTFKCAITDEALDAYDEHVKHNPNGMPLYSGKSRGKVYYGYVIHETKTSVIVEELK